MEGMGAREGPAGQPEEGGRDILQTTEQQAEGGGLYKPESHIFLAAARGQELRGVAAWHPGEEAPLMPVSCLPRAPKLCVQHRYSRAPDPTGLRCHNQHLRRD